MSTILLLQYHNFHKITYVLLQLIIKSILSNEKNFQMQF